MSVALEKAAMDPKLEELLRQASRTEGIHVVFVTRANRPLWLIMPEVAPLGAHWKSEQARWLMPLGVEHNYVEKPFIGHWELPHDWCVPLGIQLLKRFHGYYVVERFESVEASAQRCWTQVNWKDHKLQYRLITKLDGGYDPGMRVRDRASR